MSGFEPQSAAQYSSQGASDHVCHTWMVRTSHALSWLRPGFWLRSGHGIRIMRSWHPVLHRWLREWPKHDLDAWGGATQTHQHACQGHRRAAEAVRSEGSRLPLEGDALHRLSNMLQLEASQTGVGRPDLDAGSLCAAVSAHTASLYLQRVVVWDAAPVSSRLASYLMAGVIAYCQAAVQKQASYACCLPDV